ncbi:hypothetical protein BKA64DRAFT_189956 [Cadophora sp. MPI-SDFR-AT-0126]|nr:hypothetical protein BKA64DRAFT_189956 [Leotiomycetes sp. MPI-SDFR-AT-0126]
MPLPRRWMPLLCSITGAVLLWIHSPIRTRPRQSFLAASHQWLLPNGSASHGSQLESDFRSALKEDKTPILPIAMNFFQPGIVKPVGQKYTRTLVIPRTSSETTDWVQKYFQQDEYFDYKAYVVDVVGAPLSVPQNKGHEVMVYLTSIIDHYQNLSDVNIFMHYHRKAWHNNDLLDGDAVQVVARLSSERVQREGYMNLRCHWEPGCPNWMHPGMVEEDVGKQEQTMLAKSWSELFPLDPIPNVLAQPCCAQFAVSGDRLRSLPLERYVYLREWLLKTSMSDYFSGRLFEYVWQFIFTGKNVMCPKEHVCYCDGFGICFGAETEYDAYQKQVTERTRMEEQLKTWNELNNKWKSGDRAMEQPEPGKDTELSEKIDASFAWCDLKKKEAKDRGDVAKYRAQEVGREWRGGDGY